VLLPMTTDMPAPEEPSPRGTQFRQWATNTLREYLAKGFAIDDERLMAGLGVGADYFDELLERICAIRASERRFQKVTDVYATSIDYDKDAPITQDFYATVQNKLHCASTAAPPPRSSPSVPTPRSRIWV
jgi:hypothetical protein